MRRARSNVPERPLFPPEFAADYRDRVVPQLRERCAYGATLLLIVWALDLDHPTYSDIFASIWVFAWRHGGAFLPGDQENALDLWIHRRLDAEIRKQLIEVGQEPWPPSDGGPR